MRARPTTITCRTQMREERRDLRRLLEQLSDEQWRQESLCAGWSIGDLVAHLIAWDDLLLYRSRREQLRALLRFSKLYAMALGNMDRLNRRIDARVRGLAPDDLCRRFGADDGAELKWLFDGTSPGTHLAEYVIHHQDIRRPLGMVRQIPDDRLIGALNGITRLPGASGRARRLLRQRRWEATDVDWCSGSGAVVSAPGETILMALAGRPAALDELAAGDR